VQRKNEVKIQFCPQDDPPNLSRPQQKNTLLGINQSFTLDASQVLGYFHSNSISNFLASY